MKVYGKIYNRKLSTTTEYPICKFQTSLIYFGSQIRGFSSRWINELVVTSNIQ